MSRQKPVMDQQDPLSVQEYMHELGLRARGAAKHMATAPTAQKDSALRAIANSLRSNQEHLLKANAKDLKAAQRLGLEPALLDRLALTVSVVEAMAVGCEQVAALSDPVGQISDMAYRPSGIQVGKMRVALGVIGIIYESRPNVTVDAAILALKSGNATILRGGSESLYSNQAIAVCIHEGLLASGLPIDAVQVVATSDRAAVGYLISMPEFVDVIVPRGGKSLIERIARDATVPTIKHLDGICHVYIDQAADLDKALAIAVNAKTHRYGVCNALETLLIHSDIALELLPQLADEYLARGVELRLCNQGLDLLNSHQRFQSQTDLITTATDDDWQTEYLAPILAIKLVDSADQAIEHIALYSSQHTDCIVTESHSLAMRFLKTIDSASVMINASTRFADGFEYGLGAEIGISTDKLHARGPVGLEGLTSQKYIVFGDGHIRQ
jgi:glutamate-5-semialdehyde dehydrogenase